MVLQHIFKKPILVIGLLFMTIFLLDLSRRGIIFNRDKVNATSCRSALVMLNKRIPSNWHINCNKNNLEVVINENFENEETMSEEILKAHGYRQLANHLIFISKNSLNESLARTFMITVKLESKRMIISAVSEGHFIARLATITKPEFIAEHLKNSVQVREKIK